MPGTEELTRKDVATVLSAALADDGGDATDRSAALRLIFASPTGERLYDALHRETPEGLQLVDLGHLLLSFEDRPLRQSYATARWLVEDSPRAPALRPGSLQDTFFTFPEVLACSSRCSHS